MDEYKITEKVSISIEALYNRFGLGLRNVDIIRSEFKEGLVYFDLINEEGVVAMDGEEVEIEKKSGNRYYLKSTDGERVSRFILTKKEFEIATFK